MKRTMQHMLLWLAVAALFAVRLTARAVREVYDTLAFGLGGALSMAGILGAPTGQSGVYPNPNPAQIGPDHPDGTVWPPRNTSFGASYGAPPVGQQANPSQTAMSYALGQSAVVLYSSSQSPSGVVLNIFTEQTVTVTGLVGTTSLVFVNKPTHQAGLILSISARCTAANTLGLNFGNMTGSTITPTGSQAYLVIEIRGPLVQTMTMAAATGTAGTLSPQPAAVSASGAAGTGTSIQTFTATPNTAAPWLSHGWQAVTSVAAGSGKVGMPTGLPMTCIINAQASQSGLGIVGVRLSGPYLLEVTWMNATAAPITPTASGTYLVVGFRGISLKVPIVEFDVNVGTLAAVNTITAAEQTVGSVIGLAVGDQELGTGKPADQAGIGQCLPRIVGTISTLTLKFVNPTAGGVTPTGSEVYRCPVWKTGLGSAGDVSGGGRQVCQQFSGTFVMASVAANTTAEQTLANVTGLISGAPVYVNFNAPLPLGIGIANQRVSAAGTLAIGFANDTSVASAAANLPFTCVQFGVQGSIVMTGTGTGVTWALDESHHQVQELLNTLQGAEVATGWMVGK